VGHNQATRSISTSSGKDHALDDPDLLPPPDEVAAEIVESLETALDRFRNVAKALGEGPI